MKKLQITGLMLALGSLIMFWMVYSYYPNPLARLTCFWMEITGLTLLIVGICLNSGNQWENVVMLVIMSAMIIFLASSFSPMFYQTYGLAVQNKKSWSALDPSAQQEGGLRERKESK